MSVVELEAVSRPGGSEHLEEPAARAFLEDAFMASFRALQAARTTFLSDQGMEAVHGLRVAARRFRGIIALIRQLSPGDQLADLSQQARALARAVATLRELDVLHAALLNHLEGRKKRKSGERLAESFITVREQARHAALATVNDLGLPPPAFMTRRVSGTSRPRLRALDGMDRRDARAPASDIAARLLDGLARRVSKRSRGLRRMGTKQRHDLRIAVKNLRYATETFAALFADDPRHARYLRRLARFQDLLGVCNDAATAKARLNAVTATAGDGDTHNLRKPARRFLAAQKKKGRNAAAQLKRRSHRLERAEPFWRTQRARHN